MNYRISTLKEQPELMDTLFPLHKKGWPTFMRMDPIAGRYWDPMMEIYPELQFFLLDTEDHVLAAGNSILFHWDGNPDHLPSGWDGVLVAPVRPSLKHWYPLIPMEQYTYWKQENNAPFDPWLRVHWKAGAEILKVAEQSMEITGTIANWENWTEMKFPADGEYIIQGALNPISIDHQKDLGHYIEPNVWMKHHV